jgi:Zn-finger nucleic acid-binding protein
MHCVTCHAEVDLELHHDADVWVCPEGHGLWLPALSLLSVIDTDPNATAREVKQKGPVDEMVGECPECSLTMHPVRYSFTSEAIASACPAHGIWMDDKELKRLQAWASERFAPGNTEHEPYLARAELHASDDSALHTEFVQINIVAEFFQDLRNALGTLRSET